MVVAALGLSCAAGRPVALPRANFTLSVAAVEAPARDARTIDVALSQEDMETDLSIVAAVLDATLERALPPGRRGRFQPFFETLGAVPTIARDVRTFCDELGAALMSLGEPRIFATDPAGARCLTHGTSSGYPSPRAGDNCAAEAPPGFVLRAEHRPEGSVFSLCVSDLDRAERDPGFENALKTFAAADLGVLDLRGARGRDPAAAIRIAKELGGTIPRVDTVGPSTDWAASLRRRYLAAHPEDAAEMRWSVEAAHPGAVHSDRELRVLQDGACEEACELLALSLQEVGESWGHRTAGHMQIVERGLLVLPRSGVTVVVPLATRVLSPPALLRGGVSPRMTSDDPRAIGDALFRIAEARHRVKSFEGNTLVCGEPVSSLGALDPQARNKVDPSLTSALSQGSPEISAYVRLSVHRDRAGPFLESCGFRVSTLIETREGDALAFVTGTTKTWLRLLPHPVLVETESPLPPGLDALQ
jgi:hypothetical protein